MIQKLPIYPAFEENNLPIVLESSDYYAPYAAVTMLSIIEHTTPEHNYDFLVLSWDMKEETAQKLISMADRKENISIRVVDVAERVEPYLEIARNGHFWQKVSCSWVVRVLIAELLLNYDLILNVDCDMLFCADIAELFKYAVADNYMVGALCMNAYVMHNNPSETVLTDDYVYSRLKMHSIKDYINTGLVLLNINRIRSDFTAEYIMKFILPGDGSCLTYYEQDAFNGLFDSHKGQFPIEWNWEVDTRDFISNGKKFLPANDAILNDYYETEKQVKNYHFVTLQKPWVNSKVPYANKWWDVARRSRWIDMILSRENINQNDVKTHSQDILFLCDSPYQLINIINIKVHYYVQAEADLLLCSSTALVNKVEEIEHLGIFRQVIVSDYHAQTDYDGILELSVEERTLHPESYKHVPKLKTKYSDLFIPVSKYHYYQMIYYSLVKEGNIPAIHIFDEGGSSYTDNLLASEYPAINHQLYSKEMRFYENIRNMYLYRPEFYCGKSRIPIVPIPLLSEKNVALNDMLFSVFGRFDMPDERYLFFNEAFMEDDKATNEIMILNSIARRVGKENIAVKMHPRSIKMEELYRFHGYHIFSDGCVPWEIVSLTQAVDNKVLISMSSNTIWTPFLIAGKNNFSISLLNTMKLSKRPHARAYEYQMLISKIRVAANRDKVRFFCPNSLFELDNTVRYIEGGA